MRNIERFEVIEKFILGQAPFEGNDDLDIANYPADIIENEEVKQELEKYCMTDEKREKLWARLLNEVELEEKQEIVVEGTKTDGIGSGISRNTIKGKMSLCSKDGTPLCEDGLAIYKMLFAYRKCNDMDVVASFLSKIHSVLTGDGKEYAQPKLTEIYELFKENDEVDVIKHFYEVLRPSV